MFVGSYREGNGTPLQYSCLENPMDGEAWKAAVHGVAEGWTQGPVSSSREWMSHGRLLVLPGVNLPLNSLQASLSPHWWNAYFKYCL